jgi:hypothetical protein
MSEKGKRDKGQKEDHKKPRHTLKEKRKLKHEKKHPSMVPSIPKQ